MLKNIEKEKQTISRFLKGKPCPSQTLVVEELETQDPWQ